ncbi:MAG TPA: ABC transporter permease [Candidatus Sulfotelmatobacter sp.]|nr:ABC transporter permease [Candidatus Sulfotelmatobacter sp.]
MLGYALRRLGIALALVWVVATVVFLVIHVIPGDPAELLLSQGGMAPDPAAVAELRGRLGLDRPLAAQYAAYLGRLARGDLGTSLDDDHPVADELMLRLPRTLELIGAAGLIALLAGLPAGALAALRAGRPADRALSGAASLCLSIPVFVVGTLAILVLAQQLRWMPAGGYVALARDPLQHVVLLAMPAGSIALGLGAVIFRMTRSAMLEVLGRDYVRAAAAKGLAPARIVLHHVLRGALVPIVTVLALHLGTLLGGTVLVEYLFNWPGLSGYLVRAVEARDYPEVVGIVLAISVLAVLLNLVVDLLYAVLDPRVRHA